MKVAAEKAAAVKAAADFAARDTTATEKKAAAEKVCGQIPKMYSETVETRDEAQDSYHERSGRWWFWRACVQLSCGFL